MRDCITLYNCIRLTPIFRTALNYSTTGSRVVVWEFCGMQGLVVLWSLHQEQEEPENPHFSAFKNKRFSQ